MKSVKKAPNNPIFDLQGIVGIEESLFQEVGLNVEFIASYEDRERDYEKTPFLSRLKENLFETGCANNYNVCEWASIARLERGDCKGNIAALRAAVAVQAILLRIPWKHRGICSMCQYTCSNLQDHILLLSKC